MDKILIIKTSSLGDIVHTYPVLEYLRKKFPKAQIDWVVESQNAELVSSHPEVDNAIIISTKTWRKESLKKNTWRDIGIFRNKLRNVNYDVVFDLQGNTKSGLILSQVKSKNKVGFGSKTVPEWPNLIFTNRRFNPTPGRNIRDDNLYVVSSFFGEELFQNQPKGTVLKLTSERHKRLKMTLEPLFKVNKPRVLVCTGSAWPNKQMTVAAMTEFLSMVEKKLGCVYLFAWGSVSERQVAEQLNKQFEGCSYVLEKLGLSELQNVMSQCNLVVAMDSLPLHLAGTTDTPTYSVFGASSAAKYRPLGKSHGAFQGPCPYGRKFEKRCPVLRTCPTGACIRSLSGHQVFEHFIAFWKETNLTAMLLSPERSAGRTEFSPP